MRDILEVIGGFADQVEPAPAPTPEVIQQEIDKINNMSRVEMCRLWRFAPVGHPYFNVSKPYNKVFKERFEKLGGFSPEISKEIGWVCLCGCEFTPSDGTWWHDWTPDGPWLHWHGRKDNILAPNAESEVSQ